MTTATDALGVDADTTVIILTCDELGFSYGVNSAIYAALRMHQATSASVMVPAPWARAAAAHYNGEDVGVHLTLNSELDQYRWGPITQSPSLLDGDGAFPRTIDDIWEHADTEEVRREWQAQIERAQLWGFTVGHLDAHLAGVELKPEFFDVYLDLAERYQLPIRLPAAADERRIGFPFRALATERGVLAPDAVISLGTLGQDEASLRAALSDLGPGVTELHVHPAHDSPELRAATPSWETRVNEVTLLELATKILDEGGESAPQRIGYGNLTEAMRR
jgi:chitin disaccharide deacetylase